MKLENKRNFKRKKNLKIKRKLKKNLKKLVMHRDNKVNDELGKKIMKRKRLRRNKRR